MKLSPVCAARVDRGIALAEAAGIGAKSGRRFLEPATGLTVAVVPTSLVKVSASSCLLYYPVDNERLIGEMISTM